MTASPCTADPQSLDCHLHNWLSALTVAAIVLGIVLLVVCTFAAITWSKNRARRKPRP